VCTIVFGLVAGNRIKEVNKKDAEISDFKAKEHISDSLHVYERNRNMLYFQVTLIQDSIIEVNSFTRRLKEKHKRLEEYSSKL
jgi:hypothetical protein